MTPEARPRFPWKLALLFAALSVCITVLGALYYQSQEKHFRQDKEQDLQSIANLKVDQIVRWRLERLADASILSRSELFVDGFETWEKGEEPSTYGRKLVNLLNLAKMPGGYQDVLLLDKDGRVRLSADGGHCDQVSTETLSLLREAMRTGEVGFGDFYWCPICKVIHIETVAPLVVRRDTGAERIGAILFRIDPNQFLYPLIQAWPTASKSAETLLVRREGEEVVYLNELRHRKGAAVSFRLPIGRGRLPAAMAVIGHEGVVEGYDYRGVPVLAAMKRVPDTPWHMVAKIDDEEVFASMRFRAQMVTVAVIALIAAAGFVMGMILNSQGRRYYRQLYLLETERQALRKRAEEALQKAHDELEARVRERTAELTAANEALREYGRELRRLSAELLNAQEKERRRIASEIHDGITGSLNAIKLSIEMTATQMERGNASTESLRRLVSTLQRTIDETRRIMADLRPSILDDFGIVATINWLCREFEKIYPHIRIEKNVEPIEDQVSESLKTVIFRISQEAMNNIAKYSQADRADLSLRKIAGGIELVIRDNGRGFDVATAARSDSEGGLGLRSMRERAELAGGSFTIESNPGVGTTIRATWPAGES